MKASEDYVNPVYEPQWYYVMNGKTLGPIPECDLQHLISQGNISSSTKVRTEGMTDWVTIKDADISPTNALTPLPVEDVNNTLVWILAFVPLIIAIEYIIYLLAGAQSLEGTSLGGTITFFSSAVPLMSVVLSILDERKLRKIGQSAEFQIYWAIFLIPLYLFRRAKLLKQRNTYAIVWCVTWCIAVSLILTWAMTP